jgi:hypothetical protein
MPPSPAPRARVDTARLLIHACDPPAPAGCGAFARALRRLAGRAWRGRARRAPLLRMVQVDDLLGRAFFASDSSRVAVELPIDLPLPAGTYHVTVDGSGQQRRYTVTLEQGATFHLHLWSNGGTA